MNAWMMAVTALGVLALTFIWLWIAERRKHRAVTDRYSEIISIEDELDRLSNECSSLRSDIERIRSSYSDKRELLTDLEKQIAIYEESLSFAEFGFYEPQFNFGDSESYKERIKLIREEQKHCIKLGNATRCDTNWAVDGSVSKGRTAVNRQERLTLRAFNTECEAAIANTKWNNIHAMEKRIINAANQINKANKSMHLSITDEYVQLKIDELQVTHEYREKTKEERDHQAELRKAEREEIRLKKEAADAEREERKWQRLLDKARAEVGADTDEQLRTRIQELERSLAEAHDKAERAKSMAQVTSSGFVYVISNVGSFGEEVVKIGLTRRIDPDDRVRELGDASVPFTFDTHAMIYSDRAPELEAALHSEFDKQRVNLSNLRKEFFRVSLDEVEDAVRRLAPDADFIKDREAQQWHETLSRRNELLRKEAKARETDFPMSI